MLRLQPTTLNCGMLSQPLLFLDMLLFLACQSKVKFRVFCLIFLLPPIGPTIL